MKFTKRSMETKSRLVIDTSLLVRSFISSRSYSGELIQAWYENKYTLLMSHEVYGEIADVLFRPFFKKYHFNDKNIEVFLKAIKAKSIFIDTYPTSMQSRDAKDTKFLELAISGKADYLVTADQDLLSLKNHPDTQDLKIVTVEEILSKRREAD